MQPWVLASQILRLELLDWLDGLRRYDVSFMVNISQYLEGIQKQGSGSAQQVGGLTRDHTSVVELERRGRFAGLLGSLQGGIHDRAVMDGDAGLVHQHLDLVDFRIGAGAFQQPSERVVVPPDDLLPRGILAGLVVADAVSCHIYAHVGRRLIRAFAVDALEHGA